MQMVFAVITITSALQNAGDIEWIDDPSATPIPKYDWSSGERYRLLADFNADGVQDMALSYDTKMFGMAGGHFTLYVANHEGMYRKIGEFFAHTRAIALEKHFSRDSRPLVRLWTYHRLSSTEGSIGYRIVEDDRLSPGDQLVIHGGDGGTKMSNDIYKAVFENSDIPIVVERSETEVNGVVNWIEIRKSGARDEE